MELENNNQTLSMGSKLKSKFMESIGEVIKTRYESQYTTIRDEMVKQITKNIEDGNPPVGFKSTMKNGPIVAPDRELEAMLKDELFVFYIKYRGKEDGFDVDISQQAMLDGGAPIAGPISPDMTNRIHMVLIISFIPE